MITKHYTITASGGEQEQSVSITTLDNSYDVVYQPLTLIVYVSGSDDCYFYMYGLEEDESLSDGIYLRNGTEYTFSNIQVPINKVKIESVNTSETPTVIVSATRYIKRVYSL